MNTEDTKITDEMVEAACKAYEQHYGTTGGVTREAIRIALEASFGVQKLGVGKDNASELVNSLRGWASVLDIPSGEFVNDDCRAAAACIEDLADALRPFTAVTAPPQGHPCWPDDRDVSDWKQIDELVCGDFHRARATLAKWGLE